MYRNAAGAPLTQDRLIVVPGVGIGPAIIGGTSAEDVLATFGHDCKVCSYDSGDIFELTYDYENESDYNPGRPTQVTRPAAFKFEFGLLKAIVIGVYQKALATPDGVRIATPREQVTHVWGEPNAVFATESFNTLRFVHLGIEIDVGVEDETVMSMTAFRSRC